MADNDYYSTLGVKKGASDDEIKKAYKKLARQYHPDVRPDDKEAADKFKKVQQAYAVLGDPEKRKQYDQFGPAFEHLDRGPRGAGPVWTTSHTGAGPIDLEDLFGSGGIDLGDLFGGMFRGGGRAGYTTRGPRPAPHAKGEDIRLEIEVPFQVAATGGSHGVQFNRNGKLERINVKIPPGVETGSVIRLAGQGHPAPAAGTSGDLLLTVKVAPHPWFRREKHDVYLDVPVTPSEAALGSKVDVPTLNEGNVTLTVPAGTSSGTKLRLRGKGIVDPATKKRGDQLVVVKIVVPKQLNDEARRLYQRLGEIEQNDDPRRGLWSV